jgi:apolipoprotein N-acyltransferase
MLVFVALIPWLSSLRDSTPKSGFKSGYVFGLIFMGGQFVWLLQFVHKWTQSWSLALVPFLICTLIASAYFGALGSLISICRKYQWAWCIPLVWAGVEVFRSYIPGLALPWALLPNPLYTMPGLLQLGFYGTIFLVSAWIVLANVIGMMMMEKAEPKYIRTTALAFLGLGMLSYVRYQTPLSGIGTRILISQPGVDMAFGKDVASSLSRAVSEQVRIADTLKADLLIFPEGLASLDSGTKPSPDFPLPKSVPIVFGASRRTPQGTFQSAIGFDGEWKFADKRRLVMFGEYVPFRDQLPFLKNFNLPSGDLISSDKTSALTIKHLKIGPMLCFEGLFPDVAATQAKNGAQLIAIMSIDDWYMGSNAPEQLAAASVFRAIETGLPVARSASTGITMAVDQRGNILRQAPIGEQSMLDVEFVVVEKPDYLPVSVLFVYASVVSLLGVPIAAWVVRRKAALPSAEDSNATRSASSN